MLGLHLTADLSDCRCALSHLTDRSVMEAFCLAAVEAVGLRAVGRVSHRFGSTPAGPGGVTVTVLLAESHLCVHTWPERLGVTLDVYVCNFSGDHGPKAHRLLDALLERFQPTRTERHTLLRGASS